MKLMNIIGVISRSGYGAHIALKAVNQGHPKAAATSNESEVPVISVGYAYVNEDGEARRKRKDKERKGEELEEGEGKGMPMIAIHHRKSKYIAAEIVPEKGVNEYAVLE